MNTQRSLSLSMLDETHLFTCNQDSPQSPMKTEEDSDANLTIQKQAYQYAIHIEDNFAGIENGMIDEEQEMNFDDIVQQALLSFQEKFQGQESLQSNFINLSQQYSQSQIQLESIRLQQDTLKNRLESCESQLQMKDADLKSTKIALEASKLDLTSHDRLVTDLKQQLAFENNFKTINQRQQQELVDLKKVNIDLQSTIDMLNIEHQSEVLQLKQSFSEQMSSQIAIITQQNQAQMQDMKKDFDKELSEARERCELREKESQMLREEREELKIRLQTLSELNESQEKQLFDLRKQTEDLIKSFGNIRDLQKQSKTKFDSQVQSLKTQQELENQRINQQMSDKDRQIGYLLQENSKLNEEVTTIRQKLNQAQYKISSLQNDLMELESSQQSLMIEYQAQIKDHVDRISNLESLLKEGREQSEDQAKTSSELLDKYNCAMSALNYKTEEAAKLLSESCQLQEKNKSLIKCVTDIESQLVVLRAEFKDQCQENQELKKENGQLKNLYEKSEDEVKVLNASHIELKEQLNSSISVIQEIQSANDQLRLQISQLNQEINDVSSKLQIIEIEKSEQDSKLDTTSSQLGQLELLLSPVYITVKNFMSDLMSLIDSEESEKIQNAIDMKVFQVFIEQLENNNTLGDDSEEFLLRKIPCLIDYMQAQHKILIDKVVEMQGEQNERQQLVNEVNMLNSDNNYLKSQLDLYQSQLKLQDQGFQLQSSFKDSVINHMSTQLCHLETLTKTYFGPRAYEDRGNIDKVSLLRDLFEYVHSRFNYEAEKIRVSHHISELDMQFQHLINVSNDSNADEKIYQAQIIKQSIIEFQNNIAETNSQIDYMRQQESQIEEMLHKCDDSQAELYQEVTMKNEMISDLRDEISNLRSIVQQFRDQSQLTSSREKTNFQINRVIVPPLTNRFKLQNIKVTPLHQKNKSTDENKLTSMNSIQTSAFKVLNLQPITVEKENQVVSDYTTAKVVMDYVPSSVQNQPKEIVPKISFRDIFKKGVQYTNPASSRNSMEENHPQTNVSILTDTLDQEIKCNEQLSVVQSIEDLLLANHPQFLNINCSRMNGDFSYKSGVQTKTQDLRQIIRDSHDANSITRNDLNSEDLDLKSYRTAANNESSIGRELQILNNRPLRGESSGNLKKTLKPRHRGSLTPVRKNNLVGNKENNNY